MGAFRSVCLVVVATLTAASQAPADARGRGGEAREGHGKRAQAQASPAAATGARFSPADNGLSVHDAFLHVTWLADANYPHAQSYGLAVTPGGSMDFPTAVEWVRRLNKAAYLGHTDWQLPATPAKDSSCASKGRQGNSFGYGCQGSALGSLYAALRPPPMGPAVATPASRLGPFQNLQPYLYWTSTAGAKKSRKGKTGHVTFSFNTGWTGGNTDSHVMYVLPALPGNPFGANPRGGLQAVDGGRAVYDPAGGLTWAADGDLAIDQASMFRGVAGIGAHGAMSWETASGGFLNALNAGQGYLGKTGWMLPSGQGRSTCGPAFGCQGSPLGGLFYRGLGQKQGQPVVGPLTAKTGSFSDLQPYLYWACQAAVVGGQPTSACDAKSGPAANFAWSFSFGSGFQGTDHPQNDLYVMVYYPDPPG